MRSDIHAQPHSVHFDSSLNWQKEEEKSRRRSQARRLRQKRTTGKHDVKSKLSAFLEFATGDNGVDVQNIIDDISNQTFGSLVLETARSVAMIGQNITNDRMTFRMIADAFQDMKMDSTVSCCFRPVFYIIWVWMKVAKEKGLFIYRVGKIEKSDGKLFNVCDSVHPT
jgi:hypothetical protein